MLERAVFDVAGEQHLLVVVGSRYHAVRAAMDEAHEDYAEWAPRTVCGRQWRVLADPDGDPLAGWPPAVAPTCRGCLRILSRGLADTPPDERIGRLASAMSACVQKYGSAQCSGVPGDQAERLRRAVKAELRGKTGRLETLHRAGLVVVADDDHPGHPELDAAFREAVSAIWSAGDHDNTGSPPRRGPRPWLFDWSEWV